ncbi:mucin-2-like isoform X2 [Diprion similis]|nr:mucin-2-like isoform X2 [Diprion similis]
MKWRLSRSTSVASLLVIVFFIGLTDALRGSPSSVDQQRPTTTRRRGSARFNQVAVPDGASSSKAISPDASSTPSSRHPSRLKSGPGSKKSLRSEAGLEASGAKGTTIARRRTGTIQQNGSSTESIRPEESVLQNVEVKNTARRNTPSSNDEGETTTRRNTGDRRYLPDKRSRVKMGKLSDTIELEVPKESAGRSQGPERRTSRSRIGLMNGDRILDKTGPSVFSGTAEYFRSRTGRKTQNQALAEEKTLADSGRSKSNNANTKLKDPQMRTRGRSVSRPSPRNSDTTVTPETLTSTESVRVAIPLSVDRTIVPSPSTVDTTVFTSTTELSTPSSLHSRRGSGRSRQSSTTRDIFEATTRASRPITRGGRTRFADSSGASNDGSIRGVTFRSRSRLESNSENPQRLMETHDERPKLRGGRGRGRKFEQPEKTDESFVSRKFDSKPLTFGITDPREQTRIFDAGSKSSISQMNKDVERSSSRVGEGASYGNDQVQNDKSKIEMLASLPEITTLEPLAVGKPIELEATEPVETATESAATTTVTAVFEKLKSTTQPPEVKSEAKNPPARIRTKPETRQLQKEEEPHDNRSSRNRKPSITAETDMGNKSHTVPRGRTRTALVKKNNAPSHRRRVTNDVTREESTAAPVSTSETPSANIQENNEVTETVGNTVDGTENSLIVSRILSTTIIPKRRAMKKLNIKPKDEKEELSTASSIRTHETLNEAGRRRGSGKPNRKLEVGAGEKVVIESIEEDNYPPEFKARLAELKNSESKIPAPPKFTPGLKQQSNNSKKPLPILFSTAAQLKLEMAKKLVNPTADSGENVLEVERTTVSSFTSARPTRKSGFGNRRKSQRSTELKTEKPQENRTNKLSDGSVNFQKTEKANESVPINDNLKTPTTGDGFEKKNGILDGTRRMKQRPSFAKRRSVLNDENHSTVNDFIAVPSSIGPEKKIISKYNRAGRILRNESKNAVSVLPPMEKNLSTTNKHSSVKTLNQISTVLPHGPESDPITTSKPFARYTRRKSESKTFQKIEPLPTTSKVSEPSLPVRREFRPRTATYRRHSEPPSPPAESASIAITPKTPKFHATFKSDSTLPKTNANKTFNVQIASNSNRNNESASFSNAGIVGSSNGETGTDIGSSNVFSPTRALLLMNGNKTLLEQLRSTVAPLLSSLGIKSPIFAGAYRNTTTSGNSAIRVTPSGQPPRFSARYKGAELFVRRPNAYQPTVPTILSSTTPLTPLQVSAIPSPLDVSNPGEPKILTYYQALETANINNEQQQTDTEQPARVSQVDNDRTNANDNVTDLNETNNANININRTPNIDSQLTETVTNIGTPENTLATEPVTTLDLVTTTQPLNATTIASFGISETTTNTVQPDLVLDMNLESTPNSLTIAESATESDQVRTSATESGATMQPFDVPSTTPFDDTNSNSNSTLVPDTTITSELETTFSPRNSGAFANLLDITTLSSVFTSTSAENLETTTGSLTTEAQPSSSDSLQEMMQMSIDFPQISTVSSEVQSTRISETTPISLLQAQMQVDNVVQDPSTVAPVSITVSSSSESTLSSESFQISTTTENPQTMPSILARLSDSETPDVATVASSTQELSTPPSQEITALFGTTTIVSQVINESNSDAVTQTSQTISQELELAKLTTTQSVSQSGTAMTIDTTTTQSFERLVEQETEAANENSSTTPSDGLISSITVSDQTGTDLEFTTVTSTQLTSQYESTTATPTSITTTENSQNIVRQETNTPGELNSSNGTAEVDDMLLRFLPESTTAIPNVFATTPESLDLSLSTTLPTASEPAATTMQFSLSTTPNSVENSFQLISDAVVPVTIGSSLVRISENSDTVIPTVTMTVTFDEEVTTKGSLETTTEFNSASTLQLSESFLDNNVGSEIAAQKSVTQTILNDVSLERTTPFESLSVTTIAIQNDTLVETTTTQDLASTTGILLNTETMVGFEVASEALETQDNGTTQLTINQSTANEITTNSYSDTSTTTESTPSLLTDTPTLLARLQDVTATTTATVTAQRTAGVDVQITTRPNESTTGLETTSSSSITQSPTISTSQASDDASTSDPNVFTITTITNLLDASIPTTVSTQTSVDFTTTTEEISATSTTQSPIIGTTAIVETTLASTTTPTTTTTMTTSTPMSTTTDAVPQTTFGIDENLISLDPETTASTVNEATTETVSADVMQRLNEIDDSTTIFNEQMILTTSSVETTTNSPAPTTSSQVVPTTFADTIESSTVPQVTSTNKAIGVESPIVQNTPDPRLSLIVTSPAPLVMGRFGGNRLTPAPRFSPSSSTRAPLRDYYVYGIYPNKTIVRKRPEDNVIDGRNVNSPYVIFGIYPNGKLVRKFPNGTVIPDPPRNPVEVVFSLSTTTTTNRPSPVFYNQANQGYHNQIPAIYNNRPVPSIFNQNANYFPGVNLGLTGNTIAGNTGGVSGLSNAGSATKKMSDILLETQMGTNSNTASEISDLLTPSPNANTVGSSSTIPGAATIVTPQNMNTNSNSKVQNGGRIWQNTDFDEASRTRVVNGERSSVYIGQDKFINYWSDSTSNTSPRVQNIRINSVAGSSNLGPASTVGSSIPSFDILPGSQSVNPVTAGPGFPWLDPLDEILGVTTNSPVITASVATNTLLDNANSATILPRPINPFVEVFTPGSSSVDTAVTRSSASLTDAAAVATITTATTSEPTRQTTTTTTPAPTTSSTPTSTLVSTTTTTTTRTTTTTPVSTTTSTTSTTPALTIPTTTANPTTPSTPDIATSLNSEGPSQQRLNIPKQTAFGNTFDDLAFLNTLIQPAIGDDTSTSKTLTQAERFLTNKILSLALGNTGPTRSPKAIQASNASPNSFDLSIGSNSRSRPIIIDLLPSSTTQKPTTVKPTTQFTWRPIPIVRTTSTPVVQTTRKEVAVSVTTPKSEKITQNSASYSKAASPIPTTPKPSPRTTNPPANQGFGSGLLTALFGSNPFASPPTAVPTVPKRPATTTSKYVQTSEPTPTTQKPVQTTVSLKGSKSSAGTGDPMHSGSSNVPISMQQPVKNGITVLLNNPNPRVPTVSTSTFSPEEDAKFLAALLNSAQSGGSPSSKPGLGISSDDEAFLRAILSGQASVKPASPIAAGASSGNDAALLAALLKSQNIGPLTPAKGIRAQLGSTTSRKPPTTTTIWSPSSTYPPSIFESFGSFGSQQRPKDSTEATLTGGSGDGSVRNQVVNAAIGATRAFSRFLGAAITGAAQQLQSFVRNGTRYVSEAVG